MTTAYRDNFWKALYVEITGQLAGRLLDKTILHARVVELTDDAWGAGLQALARAPHAYPNDDQDYPCERCGQPYDGDDPYGECLADEEVWKSIREQVEHGKKVED